MQRSGVFDSLILCLRFRCVALSLLLSCGTPLLHAEAPAVELVSQAVGEQAWQQAYADQHDGLIKSIDGRSPAGFKAGLTSSAAQHKFNSDRAVYGVLPPDSKVASEKPIQISMFDRGMIELEMAFRLREAVASPIADVASLKKLVAEVAPAFELPDLGLLKNPTDGVLGIVRANVAARSFVVGEATLFEKLMAKKGFDLDALVVELRCNDDVVLSASSGDMLGGQWQNLLDLINDRVGQGWVIQSNQWLLTGAIGQMLPLQAGRFEGQISELGGLAINVLP